MDPHNCPKNFRPISWNSCFFYGKAQNSFVISVRSVSFGITEDDLCDTVSVFCFDGEPDAIAFPILILCRRKMHEAVPGIFAFLFPIVPSAILHGDCSQTITVGSLALPKVLVHVYAGYRLPRLGIGAQSRDEEYAQQQDQPELTVFH